MDIGFGRSTRSRGTRSSLRASPGRRWARSNSSQETRAYPRSGVRSEEEVGGRDGALDRPLSPAAARALAREAVRCAQPLAGEHDREGALPPHRSDRAVQSRGSYAHGMAPAVTVRGPSGERLRNGPHDRDGGRGNTPGCRGRPGPTKRVAPSSGPGGRGRWTSARSRCGSRSRAAASKRPRTRPWWDRTVHPVAVGWLMESALCSERSAARRPPAPPPRQRTHPGTRRLDAGRGANTLREAGSRCVGGVTGETGARTCRENGRARRSGRRRSSRQRMKWGRSGGSIGSP